MFNIAKQITKIRKELGLTQVQFSKIIGIEQPYLSKIESGKNVPTVETLIEIFSKLGYLMNIELKKEENKKSYPMSETITLVFRQEDEDESLYEDYCYLYYRAYKYDPRYQCYEYSLVKNSSFTSFLDYLENKLSKKIPTKTPKKVILYFSKENSVCTLRFYTNSNQYKSSSYVDIDLNPVYFNDSDSSHGLSMVSLESLEEIESTEDVVEEVKQEEIHEPELQQYQKHLDMLYEKDVSFNFSASTLSEKLEDIYQLFGDLLYLSRLDVKKDYFDRYYNK